MKTTITKIIVTAFLATQVHASELSELLDEFRDLLSLKTRVEAIEGDLANSKPQVTEEQLKELSERLLAIESKPVSSESNPYVFELKDKNGDGYVDDEWEEIIAKGQARQADLYRKGQAFWSERGIVKSQGWLGSAVSPVIQVVLKEPEYWFKNTVRLPGRFQIIGHARWGSVIRFEGNGDKVLIDDNRYGDQTNAPIGLYFEPSCWISPDDKGKIVMRNFTQTVEGVILSALNGVLPVYIAGDPDRLRMDTVKILQHNGARFGIKHGPILAQDSYPFPTEQLPVPAHNIYLKDPVFHELQLEGPQKLWFKDTRGRNTRKAAAMFLSGRAVRITGVTAYGWAQVVYLRGQSCNVTDVTAYPSTWIKPSDIVTVLISEKPNERPNSVSGTAGGFKVWKVPKHSTVPSAGGWHKEGERVL